jgi:hypothetical protein
MDDTEPVELHDDIDVLKADVPLDEVLEVEVVDEVPLLADEPSDDEPADEEEELIAQMMNPYELSDY